MHRKRTITNAKLGFVPEPIIGLTKGQNPKTPHRAAKVRVYYVEGEPNFFTVSGNCTRAYPGKFVKTCTIQAALRKGLKWEKSDEAEERQRSAQITADTNYTYETDKNGTRRIINRE